MKNVIAYTRVSTPGQSEYGDSLNAQDKQIEAFCRISQLSIARRFTDVGSARNEDNGSGREGFNKAVELSLRKGWPIIVAKPCRFTRTTSVLVAFELNGGKMYAASSGFGADEAVMQGKIAAAKAAGDLIAKRTKMGQAEARKNGKTFGNPDLDEAREKAVEARSRQKQIYLREFSSYYEKEWKKGARTDQDMAEAFNRGGYSTRFGKRWTLENVRRMRVIKDAEEADASRALLWATPVSIAEAPQVEQPTSKRPPLGSKVSGSRTSRGIHH